LTALPTKDRARLLKTIALFDSPVDGERLAALEAADRILSAAGLTWADLVKLREVKREPLFSTWRATCAALLKRTGDLRAWEKKFVADLPAFPRISTKQRYCLASIADRVLGVERS
jgi:hypothetical protein